MDNKKNTHGGARVGAGRKKKEDKKPSYRISLRLNEEENKLFSELSKKESMSIGQYIRKCALDNINKVLR